MARAEAGRRRAAGVPPSVYRVLDANLNRAREGLRVLEDTARFVWDSPDLFRSLRSLRHALDRAARAAYPKLVSARDSERDEGRVVPEKARRSLPGLAAANFRRAQEALRVLEEYGKVISPRSAGRFKRTRFKLYTLEKTVVGRARYDAESF
jgi:thiamine-phosphate pyrophosphorylase